MVETFSRPIAFHVAPPSADRNTPRPHDDELRLLASPVPTQITCGFFCHNATAPIDATGCLSKIGFQVVPLLVVLNTPPVPKPTRNVEGLLSSTARLEIRPPMFAGPIERHVSSFISLVSSALSPAAALAARGRGAAGATAAANRAAAAAMIETMRGLMRVLDREAGSMDVLQLHVEHQRRVGR